MEDVAFKLTHTHQLLRSSDDLPLTYKVLLGRFAEQGASTSTLLPKSGLERTRPESPPRKRKRPRLPQWPQAGNDLKSMSFRTSLFSDRSQRDGKTTSPRPLFDVSKVKHRCPIDVQTMWKRCQNDVETMSKRCFWTPKHQTDIKSTSNSHQTDIKRTSKQHHRQSIFSSDSHHFAINCHIVEANSDVQIRIGQT